MSPLTDKAKKREAKKAEVKSAAAKTVEAKKPETKNLNGTKASKPEVERALRMYRRMLMIRLFEEQVNELYTRALMPGLAHLYVGEEAVAVGICEALREDDYITSTHRGHGHCLAKGASPDRMFAELLGKEAGYCRGKGGSMHIADPATGNLGANAIVGGSVGIATGAAFAAKRLGNGRVAVCFFGEGALGQGSLYEVMNLAQLWKLPVIYVCENNLYNEYTHFSETTAGTILGRAGAFGLEAALVDGQDVRAVNEVAARLVKRARDGQGPAFLQADTYRYSGHHVGDINREYYRTKQEEQHWKTERDPIKLHASWLLAQGHADPAKLDQTTAEARTEMEAAVKFAIASPYPSVDQVEQDVYA
jgi:TPP-dependent pyruvate/acetoin dehydrogenase alpha subunit